MVFSNCTRVWRYQAASSSPTKLASKIVGRRAPSLDLDLHGGSRERTPRTVTVGSIRRRLLCWSALASRDDDLDVRQTLGHGCTRSEVRGAHKRWCSRLGPEFVSPGLSPQLLSMLHNLQQKTDPGRGDGQCRVHWLAVAPSAVCACHPIGHCVRRSKPGFERMGPNVGPAVDRMKSVTSAASAPV